MVLTSIPVIPSPASLFQDKKSLFRFLGACQQTAITKNSPQLISISQEIPPIDPLVALQALSQSDRLNFYWENCNQSEAIAAIDTAKTLQLNNVNRFAQAQDFIQTHLHTLINTGDLHLRFAGPHFFCGFTFFDNPVNSDTPFPTATLFLPQFQVAISKNRCVLVVNLEIHPQTRLKLVIEKLWQQIQQLNLTKHRPTNLALPRLHKYIQSDPIHFQHFKSSVDSALQLIQAKKFSKIVLAHTLDILSPLGFRLVESLSNLRRLHPDCHVFLMSNGKGQHFIGASPERLMSIRNRQLTTDALAGSAPRGKTSLEDANLAHRLLNSEKEKREHRFVIDFITECLTQLGLSPQLLSSPQLLQLSNIQHLWTPIQAKVPVGVHPLEVVAALHPTPAVAGDPREIACQEIHRYETFDRSLYAAPLGWVDYCGNSEFIVGIRSALIEGDRARLYAGAGIVSGSNPDKELAEIQLKLQALLNALV